MVTSNKEDYLRALYIIGENALIIKSTDVARYLNVSKPSVTEMMQEMSKEGLVSYKKYSPIMLTKKGREIAERLTSKHRLIEIFLKNVLKIDNDFIHEEAHRLEHAFSDQSIIKLRKFLGNPTIDPHGKPIPGM